MFKIKKFLPQFGFFLLLVVLPTEVNAQFDTIVFSKEGYFLYESIIYMGDQDTDGYDDFLITLSETPDPMQARAYFFKGGNPVNQNAAFSIPVLHGRTVTACDWNRDGFRDIISVYYSQPERIKFLVYFGGPSLDTIPDHMFYFTYSNPSYNLLWLRGQNWPIDFNGDGWEELVAYNSVNPNAGSTIFFETGSTDTLPSYHMLSDTNMHPDYVSNYSAVNQQFVDIDGDGCTDISMRYQPLNIPARPFRKFYYGNPSFAFSDSFKIFDTTHIISIPDMNGDSKGELITLNYGSPFPYWYTIVMSFGTKPPNLSTDAGLNLQNSSYTYITSPGDVNHDGFNDLIVHVSYYLARLFLGGNPIPTEKADEYSFSIDNRPNFSGKIGDVTGDGVDDICIGESAEYQGGFPLINNRVYIMKGVRKPTGVEEEFNTEQTGGIKIYTSPNPFTGNTSVKYTIPTEGVVNLTVYDIMGREVYTNTTFTTKGEHSEEINFNLLNVSSGTYMIRVSSQKENGQMAATVKVAYIK
jgi:hypothetical protein